MCFRAITYNIDPESSNGDWKYFEINPKDGTIRAKKSFDRETRSKYTLGITASDGYPSAIPGVKGENRVQIYARIEIGDKNDNVPYFEEPVYTATVPESAPVQHTVIQVPAKDKVRLSTFCSQSTHMISI